MAKINTLVYKYGGAQPAQNHLASVGTKRIARTGKKGVLPSNKNIGDHVLVISERHDGNYTITHGLYRGIDTSAPDVWTDASSTYDRSTVEVWEPSNSIVVDRSQMFVFTGAGTYNDNGKNAAEWLKMVV